MKGVLAAISAGVHDAARPLTADIRQQAYEAGWTPREVKGLRIVVKGSKPPTLSATGNQYADAREHGSLGQPPSPIVRRWVNRSRRSEAVIISAIAERLEKIL